MYLQLLSDLHAEHYDYDISDIVISHEADVVLLPGDIAVGYNIEGVLVELAERYPHAIFLYVPGNHEYYGQEFDEINAFLSTLRIPNVHVLLNGTFIKDNVRFIGATLWTDFALYEHSNRMPNREEALEVGKFSLNDFRLIGYHGNRFDPIQSVYEFEKSYQFILDTLNTPFDGKNVVLTHHAPLARSIHEKYAPGQRVLDSYKRLPGENTSWKVNPCFASNHPELVRLADIWVHGHTHDSFKYNEGNCMVYANPRGYPRRNMTNKVVPENVLYDPEFIIKV